MKMTIGVVTGWVGFGAEFGLTTRLRLGLIEVFWIWGSIWTRVARLHCCLADAAAHLRKKA